MRCIFLLGTIHGKKVFLNLLLNERTQPLYCVMEFVMVDLLDIISVATIIFYFHSSLCTI